MKITGNREEATPFFDGAKLLVMAVCALIHQSSQDGGVLIAYVLLL
jgi:hypothetical protein